MIIFMECRAMMTLMQIILTMFIFVVIPALMVRDMKRGAVDSSTQLETKMIQELAWGSDRQVASEGQSQGAGGECDASDGISEWCIPDVSGFSFDG